VSRGIVLNTFGTETGTSSHPGFRDFFCQSCVCVENTNHQRSNYWKVDAAPGTRNRLFFQGRCGVGETVMYSGRMCCCGPVVGRSLHHKIMVGVMRCHEGRCHEVSLNDTEWMLSVFCLLV